MPQHPQVSVVIPNYNHAPYLPQRIESVLNQTFRDFEVIILDDKSTDGSVEIIRRYSGDPRVVEIIVNEENSGSPFSQWKRGVEKAKGEWVWFAESDDYAEPDFLERMLSAVAGDNVGLIYCDSMVEGDDKGQAENFSTRKNQRFGTDRWSRSHENNGVEEIGDFRL